jgi:seryl-tRNA synthetase
MDTQPILSEEHSLEDFIDKLEELCDCKGMGSIETLESIVRLKKERDDFKIAMIKHTQENYDTWRKEQESDAIGLMKLDLDRSQKEIQALKKENEKLKEQEKIMDNYYKTKYERMKNKDNEKLKEIEELKEEAKKIEKAVRSSHGDALELCLPIWYGQDEDEDEDE